MLLNEKTEFTRKELKMRKLASIRIIEKISPIEGADKIELAHTGLWQCVVSKNQFKVGEKAVFFEIDSALPVEDLRYEFLKTRCLKRWSKGPRLLKEVIRIRTCKFKGEISQGLFMPLSSYPELTLEEQTVGFNLTEKLKVLHYDEIAEHMFLLNRKAQLSGDQKGPFPSFIPKTDEERLQNLPEYFTEKLDVEFECTEKFDGSSLTIFYAPTIRACDPFGVCSRNFELKINETSNNNFVAMAKELDLENKLKNLNLDIAIQGELVGPGINSNRDFYEDYDYRVFRIYDCKNRKFLPPLERRNLCERLNLKHVKIIKDNWKVFQDFKTFNDFLEFVQGKTDRGYEREGMVWKSIDGFTSFKVINNQYLLNEK